MTGREQAVGDFESIRYEVEKGRARITLDRPEKLNALSLRLQAELAEALWEADNNRDVHCVIVRGEGRAFSAGYDLSGADSDLPVSRVASSENQYRGARSDMHKPSIAQVHGYCLAGGTDIALLCDLVIAAEDAVFGFPPARDLGALPTNMWIYHVGPQWAKRLMLTGDTITGREAQEIGLVLKAVAAEHLESEVEQLADRLALIDPDLLSTNKRIINMALELMGARTLQRMAAENDVRGHNTRAAREFVASVKRDGLRDTLRARDAKFGDGRARVRGREARDANGRLVEE
jgi:enoyl-CoA hydratase